MRLSNYQREIGLGFLLLLIALAMPEHAFATGSGSFMGGGAGAVNFGAGQGIFASGELSYAPGFTSAVAYVAGTIFAFAGILKLKQHAEVPAQTSMSPGLARLVAGGALLALPTITALIQGTLTVGIGGANAAVAQAILPVLQ